MQKIDTELKDAFILKPDVFKDDRGYFFESFNQEKLKTLGINIDFIQDNQSYSKGIGTFRGLHCQNGKYSQSKLIRCVKGKILDIIVDCRKGSPTYLKHIKVELSEDNFYQLFIPKGFLHGFLTLTDEVIIQYKVDEYYNKESDRSIKYDDPLLNINYPFKPSILSKKDLLAPYYKESDINFTYTQK